MLVAVDSVNVLYNYLEANAKVPWEDLRYLFGEIMYGGHITDDWDRNLCKTYLEVFMHSDMVSVKSPSCWGHTGDFEESVTETGGGRHREG